MNNEKLVSCPFNGVHRVGEKRLPIHITKCKKNYPNMRECMFNANHWIDKEKYNEHVMECPNKSILDSYLTSKAEGLPGGDNTVPPYNSNVPEEDDDDDEGEWDREINDPNKVAFVPKKAIFVNAQGLEPSQRKQLYQELFRDNDNAGTSQPKNDRAAPPQPKNDRAAPPQPKNDRAAPPQPKNDRAAPPQPKPAMQQSYRNAPANNTVNARSGVNVTTYQQAQPQSYRNAPTVNARPGVNVTTYQPAEKPLFGSEDFPVLSSATNAKNKENAANTRPAMNSLHNQQVPLGLEEEFPALTLNTNSIPSANIGTCWQKKGQSVPQQTRQPSQASQSSVANNAANLSGFGRGRFSKNQQAQPKSNESQPNQAGIDRLTGWGRGLHRK